MRIPNGFPVTKSQVGLNVALRGVGIIRPLSSVGVIGSESGDRDLQIQQLYYLDYYFLRTCNPG
jgi:hypothetical protein